MENNKNHIDQFLQEQMQKLPVELNEAHWKDAERRLDEDDKKKRPFVLFFILAVLLVGVGTSAIKKLSNNKKTKQQIVQNDQTVINNSVKKENTHKGAETEFLESNNVTDEDHQTPQSGTSNNITASPSEETSSPAGGVNMQQMSTQQTAVRPLGNSTRNFAGNKPDRSTRVNDPISTSARAAFGTTKQTDKVVAKSKQAPKSVEPMSTTSVQATTPLKGAPGSVLDKTLTTTKVDQGRSVNSKTLATVAKNETHLSNPNTTEVPNGAVASAESKKVTIYRSAEEYQKMNPRYVSGLENYTFTRSELSEKQSDSIRALANPKSAPPAEVKKKAPPSRPVFMQDPSSFFIMAGIAAAKGYSGSGDSGTDYGMSPNLGIGYQFNFSERMSLYLSMYMSYINHLNIRETGTNVSYSFDKDSTFISVTRKNLLQLHVPLQLAYKIRPRHSVYGGLGINLGLNSVSLYEDSKQSSSKKQFGYMNGIRFMDVNAHLGYEYKVTPRISLGIFYQQGFFDMTKNNYFNNQLIDRNARGGINLRYKFLR